jgi:acetyl-CoA carboxylase biotin carboxyl carrier protein
MALTDDDVREILRIIDESELEELRIDTPDFQLHVRRGGAPPPAAAAPAEAAAGDHGAAADGIATIESPMLGTFYRANAPGQEPFVDVGSEVDADTVVCLIEVMKMMNAVKAGMTGTVVEVCAGNADMVESGQPLFRVERGS